MSNTTTWELLGDSHFRLMRGDFEARVWKRMRGECEAEVRLSRGGDPAKWAGVLHRSCATPEEAREMAEAAMGVLEALR